MNKFEIIEQIEYLKKNRLKFKNYNEQIIMLYEKLSEANNNDNLNDISYKIAFEDEVNLSDEEKINKVLQDIMEFGSISYLMTNPNVKLLSKKFPLFDLFLIENKLIVVEENNFNYQIQTEPIILDEYDNYKIITEIKILLKICDISKEKKSKIIISIIMYDFLFKNFGFCKKNLKFANSVKKKFNEIFLNINDDYKLITEIIEKYKLDKDLIKKWKKELDKIIIPII